MFRPLLRAPRRLFSSGQAAPESLTRNFDYFYLNACRELTATGGLLEYVRKSNAIYRVAFPLRLENDEVKVIHAFRVVHSHHSFPSKGGLKFDDDMIESDVEALAAANSLRFALADIPWGGAKGGVVIDRSQFSAEQVYDICRRYAHELYKHNYLGPSCGLISPDYGTTTRELGIILGTYKNANPEDVNYLSAVVGKDVTQGGVRGIRGTFGIGFCTGVVEAIRQKARVSPAFAAKFGKDFSFNGRKVVLQGFGYVGKEMARVIEDDGGAVISIIEKDAAIHNPAGLNIKKVIEHATANGTIEGAPDARTVSADQAMSAQCDVYIPAAKENVINESNMHLIRAPIVAEASVSPLTPRAEAFLEDRGVFIVPDMCTTVASDFIHYVEWLKGLSHIRFGRLEKRFEERGKERMLTVLEKLAGRSVDPTVRTLAGRGIDEETLVKTTVIQGVTEVCATVANEAAQSNISFRTAAMKIALTRIANQYMALGIFP